MGYFGLVPAEFPLIRFAFEDLKCIDRKKYCHFFSFFPQSRTYVAKHSFIHVYIYGWSLSKSLSPYSISHNTCCITCSQFDGCAESC